MNTMCARYYQLMTSHTAPYVYNAVREWLDRSHILPNISNLYIASERNQAHMADAHMAAMYTIFQSHG